MRPVKLIVGVTQEGALGLGMVFAVPSLGLIRGRNGRVGGRHAGRLVSDGGG
jgi:hypothetical protein